MLVIPQRSGNIEAITSFDSGKSLDDGVRFCSSFLGERSDLDLEGN